MIDQKKVPQQDYNDMAIQYTAESHRTPRFIAWMKGMLTGSVGWLYSNFWNYCYVDLNSSSFSSIVSYQLNNIVITYDGVFISTLNGNLNNDPSQTLEYNNLSGTYDIGNSVTYGGTLSSDGIFTSNYYICNTIIVSPESFDSTKWTSISGSVWYKISPSYIGAQERLQYNSQKLTMEWALNRWFRTTFRQPTSFTDGTTDGKWYLPLSDIWIQTINYRYGSFRVGSIAQSGGSVGSISGIYGVSASSTSLDSTTYKYKVWIPIGLSSILGVNYTQIVSFIVDKMNQLGVTYTIETY